jgi:cytoskeletal protein CcmA (bactofilin family)
MREERGHIAGNVIVSEPYELWGKIGGDCRVVEKGKMYVRGTIYGDLIVEFGGRVHVLGSVNGDIYVYRGAKVVVSGTVQGACFNEGGRLFLNRSAVTLGKIVTKKGETTDERTQGPEIDFSDA